MWMASSHATAYYWSHAGQVSQPARQPGECHDRAGLRRVEEKLPAWAGDVQGSSNSSTLVHTRRSTHGRAFPHTRTPCLHAHAHAAAVLARLPGDLVARCRIIAGARRSTTTTAAAAAQHFEIRDEGDWWAAVPEADWPLDPEQRAIILNVSAWPHSGVRVAACVCACVCAHDRHMARCARPAGRGCRCCCCRNCHATRELGAWACLCPLPRGAPASRLTPLPAVSAPPSWLLQDFSAESDLGDRRQEIVFIGVGMDEVIARRARVCLLFFGGGGINRVLRTGRQAGATLLLLLLAAAGRWEGGRWCRVRDGHACCQWLWRLLCDPLLCLR